MNIPAGTTLYIGPPAKPMPLERMEDIRRALVGIPGILEAHLPQCYAEGFVDPSAQILVLVLAVDAIDSVVVAAVRHRSIVMGPSGPHSSVQTLNAHEISLN